MPLLVVALGGTPPECRSCRACALHLSTSRAGEVDPGKIGELYVFVLVTAKIWFV